LGAYRIPSETGLLIPSDYNSYHRAAEKGVRELDLDKQDMKDAGLPQSVLNNSTDAD
jgi:hypothetical protein